MSAYDQNTPFEKGYHNYWFGVPNRCPYEIRSVEREEWLAGYRQAEQDDEEFD